MSYIGPGKLCRPFPIALKYWVASDTMLVYYTKIAQFRHISSFRKEIVENFSPYFKDLSNLAEQLFLILEPSELVDKFDSQSHDAVIRLFDDELTRQYQLEQIPTIPASEPRPDDRRRSPRDIRPTLAKIQAQVAPARPSKGNSRGKVD